MPAKLEGVGKRRLCILIKIYKVTEANLNEPKQKY